MFNNLKCLVDEIETTLFGKKLILKKLYRYDGPLTMQYLPNGGIQMIINNQMVISTNIGYLATKEVEYDGVLYTMNDLSRKYKNLVNLVLPN